MAGKSTVQLTIALKDPDLDEERLDQKARNLLREIKDLDGVEQAGRVADKEMPEGAKAFGGVLLGMLSAEVNVKNTKALLGFLGDRLGGKPIKLGLKTPDGKEINLEASSREEFEFVMQKAQEFLKNT